MNAQLDILMMELVKTVNPAPITVQYVPVSISLIMNVQHVMVNIDKEF